MLFGRGCIIAIVSLTLIIGIKPGVAQNVPIPSPSLRQTDIGQKTHLSARDRVLGWLDAKSVTMGKGLGEWSPEPGFRYVMVAVELDSSTDTIAFDAKAIRLLVETSASFHPVGITPFFLSQTSQSVFSTGNLEVRLTGGERPYVYGILFVVPVPSTKFRIRWNGSDALALEKLSSQPKGQIRPPNIMIKGEVVSSLPRSERLDLLEGFQRFEAPPTGTGIVAKGKKSGFSIVVVRVPFETPPVALPFPIDAVEATLTDGTTKRTEGVIVVMPLMGRETGLRILNGVVTFLVDGSISFQKPDGNRIMPLKNFDSYDGPRTRVGSSFYDVVLAFPADIYEKISTVRIPPTRK